MVFLFANHGNFFSTSRCAEVHSNVGRGNLGTYKRTTVRRLWVRFLLMEKKYLIFLYPRSGNEAKCGVESPHLTRNVYRIGEKWAT